MQDEVMNEPAVLEESHIFEYLLDLTGAELVTEIQKIEREKENLSFELIDSTELIKMNLREDIDMRTVSLYDWEDMKRFTKIDFDNHYVFYPRYDEQNQPFYKKKTNSFIPPSGFEYLNCWMLSKPLGIQIVKIESGRKILNPKDRRYVTPEVKKTEEIFLFNFEEQRWFKAKNNNKDYLKRLQITKHIEKEYRTLLPDLFTTFTNLKKLRMASITDTVADVSSNLIVTKKQMDEPISQLLFILLFYSVVDEREYRFYLSEISFFSKKIEELLEYLNEVESTLKFLPTRSLKGLEEDEMSYTEIATAFLERLEARFSKLFSNMSYKQLSHELKNKSDVPFHLRTLVVKQVEKGFYLNQTKQQQQTIQDIFGEVNFKIRTLGQVLQELEKTDFVISNSEISDINSAIEPLFESKKLNE